MLFVHCQATGSSYLFDRNSYTFIQLFSIRKSNARTIDAAAAAAAGAMLLLLLATTEFQMLLAITLLNNK